MTVRKRCVESAFIRVTRDNNRHIWGVSLKFMNVIYQYTSRIVYICFGMAEHHKQVDFWELTWKIERAYIDSEEFNVR